MKTRATLGSIGLVFALVAAGCLEGPSEIGFLVGSPTGASFATTLDSGDTIVVQGGVSIFAGGGLPVTVDWIAGRGSAHEVIATGWTWYWGLGGRVSFGADSDKDDQLGVRVPLGVIKNSAPVFEGLVIIELAPGIDLTGGGFTLDGGIGIRWPF